MKTLLILMSAVTLFATTGKAELGWTLAQAEAYYGTPVTTWHNDNPAVTCYGWQVQEYVVAAFFADGRDCLIGLLYYRPAIIDDSLITRLLQRNLPGATWKPVARSDGVRGWDVYKDDKKLAFAILSSDKDGNYRLQICDISMNEIIDKRDSGL